MTDSSDIASFAQDWELTALEHELTRRTTRLNVETYFVLELIREFDLREGWAESGQRSCAHWLNWQCGIDLGAAREQVRVAHALPELPRIAEAFREGRVSYSKARAMTRIAEPENEDKLLAIVRCNTASHVERVVRDYRKLDRLEALDAENRRYDARSLSWFIDGDGCWMLKGRFTPEQGAQIAKALEVAMEAAYRERNETSDRSAKPSADGAQAIPFPARCADALVRLTEGYLSGGTDDLNGGDRCTVHIHTTMDTLRARGEEAEAALEHGGHLSAETSRRLACDSGVVHWEEHESGVARRTTRRRCRE